MAGRLSILTDEGALARALSAPLTEAGFEVQVIPTAPKFWHRTRSFMSTLLLVDLGTMGSEALIQLRRLQMLSNAHLIAMTRAHDENEMLGAFAAGADGYLEQTISADELVAWVEALLRRERQSGGPRASRLPIGQGITLDTDSHALHVRGRRIKLTPIEYNLLACLVEHRGEVVPRGTLLRQAWGNERAPGLGSLNLYIYYLRRKLEDDPRHPEHLLTKWGVGYYLAAVDVGDPRTAAQRLLEEAADSCPPGPQSPTS